MARMTEKKMLSQWMVEKSSTPLDSLFDRNVRWWWMYSLALVGCSAAINVSYALESAYSFARGFEPSARAPRKDSLASATQNTKNVATYAPSIASGTTFIVFNTTTNSTITRATLAASPTKNARTARSGSVVACLLKLSSAITKLATLLIPPPSAADNAARESAIIQHNSAAATATTAWPTATPRASRRGLG